MKHLGIFILGALLLASCATNKRAAYIQQVQTDIPTAIEQDYQIRIKPLDRLTVTINSKDPELAAPFNAASSYNSLNGLSSYSSSSNGNLQILTVDKEGKIQLPIIGEIDCDGLTRNELAKKIENTIRENGMVHDPIVIIQFADVKFSVLGEVARPGQFSITKDRISLFDALAMAGDLTIYGQRENIGVALIREENGMRTVHYFDSQKPGRSPRRPTSPIRKRTTSSTSRRTNTRRRRAKSTRTVRSTSRSISGARLRGDAPRHHHPRVIASFSWKKIAT